MWLKHNPGRNITAYQICRLMCPAYLKIATAEISANGFRKAGIYPFNKNKFAEHDFIIERQRERTPPTETLQINREITPPRNLTPTENTGRSQNERTPPKRPNSNLNVDKALKKNFVRAEISPLPSCSGISQTQGNKRRKLSKVLVG